MVTALLANSDPDSITFFEAEKQRDPSGIGQKYAYIAVAARPGVPRTSSSTLMTTCTMPLGPEDWVQDSLPSFNQWNQTDVTLQFLRPALDALPRVKKRAQDFLPDGLAECVHRRAAFKRSQP